MKTAAIQQSSLVQNETNVKVLKNGSSVLVSVISNKGNGKYEGSVAGVRVNFSAKNPLSVGQTFVATVNQNKGVLELIPQKQNQQTSLLSLVSDNQISKYLSDLGLIPDNLSFHLLKQMQQNKMEFSRSVLNKIHLRASKFPGNEKQISEVLMMLYQKEVELSDEELQKLLDSLEKFEENELLSKINHIKKSWLLFPFNIVDKNEIEYGRGMVKILLDERKNLLKTSVNCLYKNKNYDFLVDFKNDIPDSIFMNISEIKNQNEKEKNCEKVRSVFHKMNKNIKVIWSEKDILSGFGCDTEKLYILGGEV